MSSEKIADLWKKGNQCSLTVCIHKVARVPVPQTCHVRQVISPLGAPVSSSTEEKEIEALKSLPIHS